MTKTPRETHGNGLNLWLGGGLDGGSNLGWLVLRSGNDGVGWLRHYALEERVQHK